MMWYVVWQSWENGVFVSESKTIRDCETRPSYMGASRDREEAFKIARKVVRDEGRRLLKRMNENLKYLERERRNV